MAPYRKNWGATQADNYIRGLYGAIEKAGNGKRLWRKVEHEEIKGNIFFIRHEHHYIFFRELSEGELGVISVLHEKMDIPNRLTWISLFEKGKKNIFAVP